MNPSRRRKPPPGAAPDPLVATGEPGEWVDLSPYAEALRLAGDGRPVALVTVIGAEGSAPRGMGAVMAVADDGSIVGTVGGGDLERRLIGHAMEALRDGRPRRYHYDFSGGADQNLHKACLGKTDFLVQPISVRPRLYLFGAGHIGRALAPMAMTAGFGLTVIDDRPGYPRPEEFPPSAEFVNGGFAEIAARLPFDGSTYVVVVTYGHERDEEVVRAVLRRPWRYLGVIGSRAKVAQLKRALTTDDEAKACLARVRAPIGLAIGGRTPGEIAVAIAAELVAARHDRLESAHRPHESKMLPAQQREKGDR